ncbi:MAG: prepilin-type N-terminal cleavage/methylation domain-containing protein [uncultured Clostridium sp.]
MKINKKRGFTLIELMAVIAIIAILATVLIPTIIGYINRSRKSVVINQCKNIHRIIELRKVDEQFKFKENEKQIRDIFKENASFYNYDLITEKDVNKILEVKLEDELQYISTESLEEVIKNIEIDIIGNFKKLNK